MTNSPHLRNNDSTKHEMQEEQNMNNKNANASEFTRKYDSAYMEILATEMRGDDAREFKKLVEK